MTSNTVSSESTYPMQNIRSPHQVHYSNSKENTTEASFSIPEVLLELRAWHDWKEDRQVSPFSFLRKRLLSTRPPRPSVDKLQFLVESYFPPRGALKASICDFGDGKFERNEIAIDHLQHKFGESCTNWLKKPEWSQVRWMYVLCNANRNVH